MDLNKKVNKEELQYTILPKECYARYRVTDKQVEEIRARYSQHVPIASLMRTYHLSRHLAYLILKPEYLDKQREYYKKKK